MAVSIAEYLGIALDSGEHIQPIVVNKSNKPIVPCPFRNGHCDKAKRGNKPVCSVRKRDGTLWIVCAHRLCATQPKKANLNEHQIDILSQVANYIYPGVKQDEILLKREVRITVTDSSSYSADYVMWRNSPKQRELPVVLEMQGGGETTDTGHVTKHIAKWEVQTHPTNDFLSKEIVKSAPLETNAWRRQQEQFLVKGNVAMQTGGKMVFAVGSLIYDYLAPRLEPVKLNSLREANWTLAFLAFREAKTRAPRPACAPHSLALEVDPTKVLFTNYNSFVQALINQAQPSPTLFSGKFFDVSGKAHKID